MPRALHRLSKLPARPATLAVADLGSNSFRLEIGRVEGDQIFRLDTWRETIRFGAGLDSKGNLTLAARKVALACLTRFRERLSGLHPSGVRAVATNTFRVAKNAASFLPQAQAALGFPIDIIGGLEEARLIYVGVAHVLPASRHPRLVIDIGGGSTEFIIGRGLTPERLESLKLGCVSMSQRFFGSGELHATAFDAAETLARAEIESIARAFGPEHWREAFASSGTALALAAILEGNGLSAGGITREGLARLRKRMIGAGHIRRLRLEGVTSDRAPVLAGGFAIMAAAIAGLDVPRINPVGGALRLGVLYDLLGRSGKRDSRVATVESMVERYHIDRPHARRVATMARALYVAGSSAPDAGAAQRVEWAALLHEIGFTVSHIGFHKHGAYILENADMPGFSAQEQRQLAQLVLGCRGGLQKMSDQLHDDDFAAQVLALRLAVLFHHARRTIDTPRIGVQVGRSVGFAITKRWLRAHPLTTHLLGVEGDEWTALRRPWRPLR
ncbi:MAG: Ppx/GppA family phosphatase [Burkholderiales bacterium]|nr:Ppx/GppA family phosphatase [Burkholderiales bacterium]